MYLSFPALGTETLGKWEGIQMREFNIVIVAHCNSGERGSLEENSLTMVDKKLVIRTLLPGME